VAQFFLTHSLYKYDTLYTLLNYLQLLVQVSTTKYFSSDSSYLFREFRRIRPLCALSLISKTKFQRRRQRAGGVTKIPS